VSQPPDTAHTDIYPPQAKGVGARAALARPDLLDQDQLFDLAFALQNASDRRLMQVTLAEHRALARLTVRACIIGTHAVELIDAMEGDDMARQIAAMDALQQVVRNP
jgi:hypothetical protein